jgi:hypothetical protein
MTSKHTSWDHCCSHAVQTCLHTHKVKRAVHADTDMLRSVPSSALGVNSKLAMVMGMDCAQRACGCLRMLFGDVYEMVLDAYGSCCGLCVRSVVCVVVL